MHGWQPSGKQLNRAENNTVRNYSTWHRTSMPNSALVMDIDYIEIREGKPVSVIEATQSNSPDLEYGLFSFLSRGFAQSAILLQMAEELSVNAYVLSYSNSLKNVELLTLNRSIIAMIDDIDKARQDYAQIAMRQHNNRRKAQGEAVSLLYQDRGAKLMQELAPFRKPMSIEEYRDWILEVQ